MRVDAERVVEVRLSDLAQRHELTETSVGEEHIETASGAANRLVEPIEVRQVGNVSLDADRFAADLANRRSQV